MDEFEEKRFNTGELEINYVVGPDTGLPLVLIPPQGVDWTNYKKVLPLLIEEYHVYAVDIRGHGKSDWATGDYSFTSIGRDMTAFLESIVQGPAIISGNSSGGLVALWLAANRPSLVKAIIMEDPPLFSADWPRIREDSYVYRVLQVTVEMSKELHESRSISGLARTFMKIRRPLPNGKIRGIPRSAAYFISFLIRASQKIRGKPSLPGSLGKIIEVLVDFDPDFSQAWVDGRIYEGLDHVDALKRVECPAILLHANWVRHPDYGLVGAMDDEDTAYARELAPEMQFKRIDSEHVIHSHDPELFVSLVDQFIESLG
ncbi:MAG: 3-oxoadipate enol-lactonase 2 [Candidatus Thorarchaeota archaeon AB_25]|jgi:pimeloyl-ACP methyl ester carboxylesterase|nr:MAG: 3-oxoadipate enol-lactonase 2 [Candidatus Thorarchaeota archaeon AB_25]